jgi:UDP-N-acetylmuramoyl-tripeptide--D-alanyl-D-alanine ligase
MLEDFIQFLDSKIKYLESYPRFLCDSRKIRKGDVFVALKGSQTDGHLYIQDVLNQGALFVIAAESYEGSDERIFKCLDPLKLIQDLAKWKLKTYKPTLVGITGSCGKTTTKHFLHTIVSPYISTFATFENFNSQIGLPLALCSLEKKHKLGILEMGMSHSGDITKMREWIDLDFAIITSIGLAHAENFLDKDFGIARAKAEILLRSPEAFFNEKTNTYPPFKDYPNKHILNTQEIINEGSQYYFLVDGKQLGPFELNIEAKHLLENLHLVIAMVIRLGLDSKQIQNGLKSIKNEKQRLDVIEKKGVIFIDDSYNASPSSMKAAIEYLKLKKSKRKIAVLGEMKELGDISEKEHMELLGPLQGVDRIYCLGKGLRPLSEKLESLGMYFEDLVLLKMALEKDLQEGDCVLIKGSHSTNLHTLFSQL